MKTASLISLYHYAPSLLSLSFKTSFLFSLYHNPPPHFLTNLTILYHNPSSSLFLFFLIKASFIISSLLFSLFLPPIPSSQSKHHPHSPFTVTLPPSFSRAGVRKPGLPSAVGVDGQHDDGAKPRSRRDHEIRGDAHVGQEPRESEGRLEGGLPRRVPLHHGEADEGAQTV